MHKKLEFVSKVNDVSYYKFKPTLFKLYDNCYSKEEQPEYFNRITHHIRMTIELIKSKYNVYYMYVNNRAVGHLVVARGGGRVDESNKGDIVIGPIWICPNKRGNGLGTKGINAILHSLGITYINAYEFIARDNIASIRAAEKNGYVLLGIAIEKGLLKKIVLNPKGEWLLYKYTK